MDDPILYQVLWLIDAQGLVPATLLRDQLGPWWATAVYLVVERLQQRGWVESTPYERRSGRSVYLSAAGQQVLHDHPQPANWYQSVIRAPARDRQTQPQQSRMPLTDRQSMVQVTCTHCGAAVLKQRRAFEEGERGAATRGVTRHYFCNSDHKALWQRGRRPPPPQQTYHIWQAQPWQAESTPAR